MPKTMQRPSRQRRRSRAQIKSVLLTAFRREFPKDTVDVSDGYRGNINYLTGHAIFEATHGTAPKYANQDVVNPGSVILSGVMMLEYLKWQEAADLITKSLGRTIANKTVTYDFARLMEGAKKIKCSEFATEMIGNMG